MLSCVFVVCCRFRGLGFLRVCGFGVYWGLGFGGLGSGVQG